MWGKLKAILCIILAFGILMALQPALVLAGLLVSVLTSVGIAAVAMLICYFILNEKTDKDRDEAQEPEA